MKLIVSIFVLCSAIFASSFGRRPFVDPSVMRSKIYEDMNPYFITATNKFNELDDITSAAFQRGILVFPDLLISIRNDLNRRFERLCGNCRNDLRKYETELNINYEVLREEYSFDKVRIRFEETFQDVASRLLTPIRTYVDELRDYKSNYRNSGECWKLFKTTLFGIVKETHQNITNDLQGIKSNLESLVQNITLEFKAATDNQTATADSCNNYSRGSRDMCKFLAVSNKKILYLFHS
jgi:hypothetical protein